LKLKQNSNFISNFEAEAEAKIETEAEKQKQKQKQKQIGVFMHPIHWHS
jgi:hypothetical protein